MSSPPSVFLVNLALVLVVLVYTLYLFYRHFRLQLRSRRGRDPAYLSDLRSLCRTSIRVGLTALIISPAFGGYSIWQLAVLDLWSSLPQIGDWFDSARPL